MVKVRIENITVLKIEGNINDPFEFEIVFEAFESLAEDIEWKLIYVGSASNEKYDQLLESVLVGPVPCGIHKFVLHSAAPNWSLIPQNDVLGYTVVMLTCNFMNQEFCRVGYYVFNDYTEDQLRENLPSKLIYEKIHRSIVATDPRVTIFPIKWSAQATDLKEELPVVESPSELDDDIVEEIEIEDYANTDDDGEDDEDDEDESEHSVDLEEDEIEN